MQHTHSITTANQRLLAAFGLVACLSMCVVQRVHSDDPADAAVLDRLFAEQHVAESGIWVSEHVAPMDNGDAIDFLKAWVLPGPGRENFRVDVDFVADDPMKIASPALELVQRATVSGRLAEIDEAVEACSAKTAKAKFERQTLRALIAITESRYSEALPMVDALYQTVEGDPELMNQVQAAVLLCATESLRSPELTKLAAESLPALTEHYRTDYNRTAWHRHLTAACADAQLAAADAKAYDLSSSTDLQWHPVSVSGARERGLAFPDARWVLEAGSARKLASHGEDFLYFRSPLAGNFEVEAHATGFGYRESQLMMGGLWTGLVYTHEQYMFGDVNGERQRQALPRKLADTHSHGYVHLRAVRHEDTIATFLNGTSAHTYENSAASDPWVGIRSMYRVVGGADDIRISGSPTVPASIALIDSPELRSWYNYFHVPQRDSDRLNDWHTLQSRDENGSNVLTVAKPRNTQLPDDCFQEQLLIYTRPMLEDGEIEYEFWYVPDEAIAFPYLAGNAFLIDEMGVAEHRVTHGRFDRRQNRPDDARRTKPSKKFSPPALQPNQWNRVKVSVRGDALTLHLNGEEIHQTKIETEPLKRHFGLFHFGDQTSLMVRRATWRGSWERVAPNLSEQQLVDPEFVEHRLDGVELPDRITYRLSEDSLAGQGFAVVEGNPVADVSADSEGITLRRIGRQGYQSALIGRSMGIQGDFDVVVQFDRLERTTEKGKIASVRLAVTADSPQRDEALIQMVITRDGERTIQCMKRQTVKGNDSRHYFGGQPFESTAGRLQLSRRGNVIYYLAAENDSSQFRIIGKHEFPADHLDSIPFRFGIQVQGAGSVGATRLKTLEVRADKLEGATLVEPQELIAELNKTRESIPLRFQHNFATDSPDDGDFYAWTNVSDWDPDDGGLIVQARGSSNWTSSGLTPNPGFEGDFDIKFHFQKMPMVTPAAGKHTQIYLQAELEDAQRTQFSVMLTKTSEQTFMTQAQVRDRIQGSYKYTNIGNIPSEIFGYFRLARRGKMVHFLAGDDDTGDERLIASRELGDVPVSRRAVRMMLHTGNPEGVSEVLVQSIEVRATSTSESLPILVTPPRQPSRSPSLPESILESIKGIFQ